MERTTDLSFIIPVYNAESTLRATVQSILNQDNGRIEIVLVDDGSTDGSGPLCDALRCENAPVISVIHQVNRGSQAARMAGAARAKGRYLLYVDADDLVTEGAVDHICGDIGSGSDLYIYDFLAEAIGGKRIRTVKNMPSDSTEVYGRGDKKVLDAFFREYRLSPLWATAIKRECHKKIEGIPFPVGIKYDECRLQKLFLLAAADTITYIPYAVYHFKWVAGSQSWAHSVGLFHEGLYDDYKAVWSIEREYYSKLGYAEQEAAAFDGVKLGVICGNLRKRYLIHGDSEQLRSVMQYAADDELFQCLSEDRIRNAAKEKVRTEALFLREHKFSQLLSYWDEMVRERKGETEIKHTTGAVDR